MPDAAFPGDLGLSPHRGEDTGAAAPRAAHMAVLLERIEVLEQDLVAARAVQRFMLPPDTVDTRHFRLAHFYQPLHHIGGDFVDLRTREDGSVVTFVGDIAGHGVPAAMTFAMLKLAFTRHSDISDPAALLSAMQRELADRLPSGTFVTAVAAVFAPDGRFVRIASAGHPHPVHVTGSEVRLVETAPGFPLLVAPELDYDEELHLELSPGDRVIFLTDGTLEAREVGDGRTSDSSAAALMAAMRANLQWQGPEFLRSVYESLFFGNFVFRDDVTLLSVAAR